MVVCRLGRVFRSPFNTYRAMDCISEICASYHYQPPYIALLHLCFCRIFKNHSSILFPNGFMGSYWHCSYRTKFVFCILLYGQISTMGKGKINSKSTRNKRWKIIIRQIRKHGMQEPRYTCVPRFTIRIKSRKRSKTTLSH